MGNSQGVQAPGAQTAAAGCPHRGADAAAQNAARDGACPVKNGEQQPQQQRAQEKQESGCPMHSKGGYKNPKVYNVYSQEIDPTNQMPVNPNNLPAPDQDKPLSTERVKSTIPKGGTEDTWVYPSPQMFWNALKRKNKVEDSREDDMDVVVAIHNNMNETTWRQVLEWEKMHEAPDTPDDLRPRLLRFQGRPHDYSPKARLKHLFGHPLPFDRHDWIVDRGGKEVRYVIDYYHDESLSKQDKTPSLLDVDSMKSIKLDVRPAIDSVEAIVDRVVRMPYAEFAGKTNLQSAPFFASQSMKQAEREAQLREQLRASLENQFRQIGEQCQLAHEGVAKCQGDEECMNASLKLTYCIAGVVCPKLRDQFDDAMTRGDDAEITAKYEAMEASLTEFRKQLASFRQK